MTRIGHIAVVVQDLDKAVELFSRGFGLTPASRKDYPDLGIKVAVVKAENLDVELIEPTGPGNYWEFRSPGPASFNHLSFEGDTIPSLGERSDKLGIREKKDSTRKTESGTITDLDPETTLGLRLQVYKKG